MLAPKGALEIHEQAWNCYPYCKTVISVSLAREDYLIWCPSLLFPSQNPDYMKDGFHITIETIHVANDKGEQHNVCTYLCYVRTTVIKT